MAQLGRSAGLTGFLEECREAGLDAFQLAAGAGLPASVLTDPELWVSVEAMGRVLETAAELSGVDDFGLRLAERRRISNMGVVGLVIREQPTLRKALQAYARFQWLHNDAYGLTLEETDQEDAVLVMRFPPWQRRQLAEMMMGATVRMLRAVMGEHWRPRQVWLPHAAPARTDAHRRVLGVTPRFDQDQMAIVIPRAELDVPIPTADPAFAEQVTRYLERLARTRKLDLTDKVSDIIVALLPDGVCTADRVAQHLGMDRRTLHRRLSAEGVTFSGLLDGVRREMAVSLLTESDRPLQSVADLLGFSSLSAFAHWFRRHFGQSASAYRAGRAATPALLAPAE
ncbi:AraC family transcriptional regulator [Phenylobacterium sp.]|uniref:AraC family transcriptional regulator n=1 Tax=Phenylobacterium sp. TaxID=1871053 RepID=UPI0025F94D2C|nr:AraC family transcriptional regulator [Phenylobacterium sp.]